MCPILSGVIGLAVDITGTQNVRLWLCSRLRCCVMRNDSARLTPRGELVADIVTALMFLGMGYAVVRAMAVVVVKLGQMLGII